MNAIEKLPEKPRELVEFVEAKLVKMIGSGALQIPANYSAENAMKAAYLILQRTVNKDKKPVLTACTPASISNALMDMVTLALDPNKKQCYFIAYGDVLSCQQSYFGSMGRAKNANPAISRFTAEVVYAADELEYEIRNGEKFVTKHTQKLANVDPDKIIGVYAMALDAKGNVLASALLTMSELMASWAQSKAYPIDKDGNLKTDSTHYKHTAEMAKKTAISRVCKYIVNSSDDAHLFREALERTLNDDGTSANGEELDLGDEGSFTVVDGEEADTTTGEIAGPADDAPAAAGPADPPAAEAKPEKKSGKAPF